MATWKRTDAGSYTVETPAGNDITIAKHGKVWRMVFRGRGHDERSEYATRGAAMADAIDICCREQAEIDALPGGGCG